MTSPPYGDNKSTVPYGQSAYLPLHWIDLGDIDDETSSAVLKTTHEIDRMSLGGQRPRWPDVEKLHVLRKYSPSLDKLLRRLARTPHDRTTRVVGFVRDLAAALPKLLSAVRVNGYLVWTIGNRRVGGSEVPLADILSELLCQRSAILLGRCTRRIPQKRMAIRNSISGTIRTEHLLVFRRVPATLVR
jgi:site-specific DNA-methyltransferase (cytosine-N4-specific)